MGELDASSDPSIGTFDLIAECQPKKPVPGALAPPTCRRLPNRAPAAGRRPARSAARRYLGSHNRRSGGVPVLDLGVFEALLQRLLAVVGLVVALSLGDRQEP